MSYEKLGGEASIVRTRDEVIIEEELRLGQFAPAPLKAHPKIDFKHLHLIKSVVGNPFYNHDPDDEPNTDALVA